MPGHRVIENEWITLQDGVRLAARIWMPDGPGPFPVVLEYLPYRKRNGTSPRDESTYPVFADAGIVGVRVDIRGSGESDGVIDGEYTPRELSDGCEVIDWIARQSWSNGNVGMMGISWGGFNSLQIAALKPAALKAVISIASTVDRYNDDIHYKNGCHLSAQLSWAATMLAYQSRPPDPEIVGERWREMWRERLENEPFFLEEWLGHQRRDDFWKHGSICEDFASFDVPALVIAGWADGYRNTPFKAAAGIGSNAKAVIGPWIHKYPHFAWPKPRWDFHAEAIAWWNRYLRDDHTVADSTPQLRAYILDGPKPARRREEDPGFWISMPEWKNPEIQAFGIDPSGRLAPDTSGAGVGQVLLHSPLDTGTASGEWFTLKPDAEMAGDQRADDAGSLVFETEPLAEACIFLGQPTLSLDVACATDWTNLVARIVDVHPDGAATRVSLGMLNLAHRDGNAAPIAMPHGEMTHVTLDLDACGYRFQRGHRIRLALSTSYWPTILPSPQDPVLEIDTKSLLLALPLLGAHERVTLPQPGNADPLPRYIVHESGRSSRRVERDLNIGVTVYTVVEDGGMTEHPDNGLMSKEVREEAWSVTEGDPLSMHGEAKWEARLQRGEWRTSTRTSAMIRCTANEWIVSATLDAFEAEQRVFKRSFEKRIARDFM
jgi:uncharacterized protein